MGSPVLDEVGTIKRYGKPLESKQKEEHTNGKLKYNIERLIRKSNKTYI